MSDTPGETFLQNAEPAVGDPAFEAPLGTANPYPEVGGTHPISEEARRDFPYGDSIPLDHQARAAGYSWPEIDNHVAQASTAAVQAGYTQPEIDQHLGYQPPDRMLERARAQFAWQMSGGRAGSDMLDALSKADPKLLLSSPTLGGDYARAVAANETKGPLDFATNYAAGALQAAASVLEPSEVQSWLLAGASAARELATTLPNPRDVTDAALSVGGAFDTARQNLLDHWQETGEHPIDAAMRAQTDAALSDKLTTRKLPPPTSMLDYIADGVVAAMTGGGEPVGAGSRIPEAAAMGALSELGQPMSPDTEAFLRSNGLMPQHLRGPVDYLNEGFFRTLAAGVSLGRGAFAGIGGAIRQGADEYPLIFGPIQAATEAFPDFHVGGAPIRLPPAADTAAAFHDLGTRIIAPMARRGEPMAGWFKSLAEKATVDVTDAATGETRVAPVSEAMAPVEPAAREPAPVVPESEYSLPAGAAAAGEVRPDVEATTSPWRYALERSGVPLKDMTPELYDQVTARVQPNFWDQLKVSRNMAINDEVALSSSPAARRSFLEQIIPPGETAGEPVPAAASAAASPTQRFVADATPAAKIEALAQEHAAADTPAGAPPTFADLAKNEDPATQEYAAGLDALNVLTNSIKSIYDDLIANEEGSLKIFDRGPSTVESERNGFWAQRLGKNVGDMLIRKYGIGGVGQTSALVAHQMEPFFKDFAPHLMEWKDELDAIKGLRPGQYHEFQSVIGKAINAIEGKGVLAPGDSLFAFTEFYRGLNDWVKTQLIAAAEREEIPPVSLRENYMAHQYKDTGRRGGGGGNTGNLNFTKERTFPTKEEALNDGFESRYTHPILDIMSSIDTKMKALATLKMQKLARDANWMYYAMGRKDVEPGDVRLYGLGTEKMASTTNPDGTPGRPVTQTLYAPRGLAKIWNNWANFETYTTRTDTIKSIEDYMLRTKNAANYIKLMWPGFHMTTITKQSYSAGLTSLMQAVANRDWSRAGWRLLQLPISPVAQLQIGRRSVAQRIYQPVLNDPALKNMVDSGFVFDRNPIEYRPTIDENLFTSWRRGTLALEMRESFEQNRGMFVPHLLGRFVTSAMAPFWDYAIPTIKAGAEYMRNADYLRANPAADEGQLATFGRRVRQNIDDRFGEYNMKQLYWPVMLKRIAAQLLLSQTWKFGTIHATLAGMGYEIGRGWQWNPVATTNLAAQVATVIATNYLWNWATGQLTDPREHPLDYLLPWVSSRHIARLMIPGEEKEQYDWAKIGIETEKAWADYGPWYAGATATGGLLRYGYGALNPVYKAAIDFMAMKDAVNHNIGLQPGGAVKFLFDEFGPIFLTSHSQNVKNEIPMFVEALGGRGAAKFASDYAGWAGDQEKRDTRDWVAGVKRAIREGSWFTDGMSVPPAQRSGGGGGGRRSAPAHRSGGGGGGRRSAPAHRGRQLMPGFQ